MSSASTFGSWLRQRRNETGVTQEELADELGFSLALLRKLESAERRPSGQIANLVAQYFQIPADEHDAFVAFARTGKIGVTTALSASAVVDFAPWRGAYLRQTNLPATLTPIIGRQRETALALDYLQHSKTRLLTLTGTPGIGKTRLGLTVAAGLVETFEDGVFFVDLAPVINPELVIATIARTLGLKALEDRFFERVLMDYLSERRILLFLDNFEQILDAATAVVRLLEVSPWLKVLITSREALHVRGERRLNVLPLALPDPQHLNALEGLAAYPAVQLFVERAQAVTPDFELNQENAADVSAVCIGLEGVPLAIELAAARVRHFSPKELHAGLVSRLKLLTSGARDLPIRQRTLRNAIDWSYALLNSNEQRLLRFAGVFVGGFTAKALEPLAETQPVATVSIFDTLLALSDKNLVRTEKEVAEVAEVRFGLLETVREYALEQLVRQGEMAEARRGHSSYYLALAERAEQHFTGAQSLEWGLEQLGWIDKLEAELDNMRAALAWYQSQVEATAKISTQSTTGMNSIYLENLENGLRLATNLRRVWFSRDHFTEGVQWLTVFLSKVPRPVPVEPPRLRAIYAKAIAIMGRLAPLTGNVSTMPPLLHESLSIATELEDKELMAFVLFISGVVAQAQDDYVAARTFQSECLKLYRELGNKWGTAAVLQDLGIAELNQGNFSLAYPMLEESLQLFREVGETVGVTSVVIILGELAYYQGDYGLARTLLQEGSQLQRKMGFASMTGYPEVLLGWLALREGKYSEATTLLKEGIHLKQQNTWTVYWGLLGLGALEQDQQQPARAALFFGAAEAFGKAGNIQLPPLKRVELEVAVAAAHTQLPDAQWCKAWDKGYALISEVTKEPEAPRRYDKGLAGLLEALGNQHLAANTE